MLHDDKRRRCTDSDIRITIILGAPAVNRKTSQPENRNLHTHCRKNLQSHVIPRLLLRNETECLRNLYTWRHCRSPLISLEVLHFANSVYHRERANSSWIRSLGLWRRTFRYKLIGVMEESIASMWRMEDEITKQSLCFLMITSLIYSSIMKN
jgi:hypothetical protein